MVSSGVKYLKTAVCLFAIGTCLGIDSIATASATEVHMQAAGSQQGYPLIIVRDIQLAQIQLLIIQKRLMPLAPMAGMKAQMVITGTYKTITEQEKAWARDYQICEAMQNCLKKYVSGLSFSNGRAIHRDSQFSDVIEAATVFGENATDAELVATLSNIISTTDKISSVTSTARTGISNQQRSTTVDNQSEGRYQIPGSEGKTVYCVQIGGFPTKEPADALVKALKNQGFQAVTVFYWDSFRAQIGVFTDRDKAAALGNKAVSLGYDVTVRNDE